MNFRSFIDAFIDELVHSEVKCPMPFLSIGRTHYYVLFTDDFSGYRTINFMKCRSEVSTLFSLYVAYVLNQTGNSIPTLRFDNGRENEGKDFKKFLAEKGIRH